MMRIHKHYLLVAVLLLCLPCYAADMDIDVDTAVELVVNKVPIVASADGYTIDETIAYNESGMALNWNFITSAGAVSSIVVTPTTAGDYDWSHVDAGIYKIEMTATGGASANNDTEGYGWFSGVADAILPFASPVYRFRAAALNNADTDGGDVRDVNVTLIEDVDATNQINAEADTALTDYDPPTNTEFEARTIAAADYFDPAADAVANVTLVATTTTNTDMRGTDSALLAASAPTNFADLAITETTGYVTAGTVGDKTGYGLAADQSGVTIGTVSTLTGHTAQTGDSYALASGVNGFAAIKGETATILADTNELQTDDYPTLIAALPTAAENRAEIDSNSTQLAAIVADTNELQGAQNWDVWDDATRVLTAGTNISIPSAADNADAVWEELIADHSGTSGSVAEQLAAAGAAGDPWNTALPGAYAAGKAGYIVGTYLDDQVSEAVDMTDGEILVTHATLDDDGDALKPLRNGSPLGGVTIRAYRASEWANLGSAAPLRDSAISDDAGEFALQLSALEYKIVGTHPTYGTQVTTVTVTE